MRLVYPETPGQNAALLAWVSDRIPHAANLRHDHNAKAIAVVIGQDTIAAGIVFNEYYPAYGTIQAHVAADTPKWASHRIVRAILAYPFTQLRVNKVWTAMPHTNCRAVRFNIGIGFTQEGILVSHFGGANAVVTRLFAKDYRRFYERAEGHAALARHWQKSLISVRQLREAA